jgi:hypothetical protein
MDLSCVSGLTSADGRLIDGPPFDERQMGNIAAVIPGESTPTPD